MYVFGGFYTLGKIFAYEKSITFESNVLTIARINSEFWSLF